MDKLEIINKLKDKANVSYEIAEKALENSNWDPLDAMVYLETTGVIPKPSIDVFSTNEARGDYNERGELVNIKTIALKDRRHKGSSFHGLFETICGAIDTCNNIFIQIVTGGRIMLKIPLTVLIVLSFFAFWIIVPFIVVALFCNVEFIVVSKVVDTSKVNGAFASIYKNIKVIKEKIRNEVNNG